MGIHEKLTDKMGKFIGYVSHTNTHIHVHPHTNTEFNGIFQRHNTTLGIEIGPFTSNQS